MVAFKPPVSFEQSDDQKVIKEISFGSSTFFKKDTDILGTQLKAYLGRE